MVNQELAGIGQELGQSSFCSQRNMPVLFLSVICLEVNWLVTLLQIPWVKKAQLIIGVYLRKEISIL